MGRGSGGGGAAPARVPPGGGRLALPVWRGGPDRGGGAFPLAFVEVKLRKDGRVAQAREFVDRRKQEKLRTTAQLYLAEHPTQLQPRFDVVEIYAPQGLATRAPEIYVIPDAF